MASPCYFLVQAFAQASGREASALGSVEDGVVVRQFGTNWPLRAQTVEQAWTYLNDAWHARVIPGRAVYQLTRPGKPDQAHAWFAIDQWGVMRRVELTNIGAKKAKLQIRSFRQTSAATA